MPKGYPPSVFVSSTCYDLAQIRLDLKRFIEGMGYEAMISESPSFPVNPQATAVENCLNAVRDRADIFVLIIGARYGNKQPGGRSITNLEFLEARTSGVPIYVFVAKEIIHNLRIWKKNPDADYTSIVDDPRLFSFVDELRNASGLWMYDFDEVANIVDTLRKQWGILFTESLLFRSRLQSPRIPAELAALPAEALSIFLERPFAWEARLLASVLKHELASQAILRRDLKYGLKLSGGRHFEDVGATVHWLGPQIGKARVFSESCAALLNSAAQEAMGPPGQQADAELLVYVGSRLGQLVRKMREWQLELAEAEVDEPLRQLFSMLSFFCEEPITKIEALPQRTDLEIERAEEARAAGDIPHLNLSITLELRDDFMKELTDEFARVTQYYAK